jgi:SAM-dependent methyltransferase
MQHAGWGRRGPLRGLLREVLPPVLYTGARFLRRRLDVSAGRGELRAAGYYDEVYEASAAYKQPYWESRYYFLWSVVADRLVRANVRNVLDIGCGPGQFAALLRDKGFDRYCGVDFSVRSVELAKQMCPAFEFVAADLSQAQTLRTRQYDCVIALEFLEHVQDDIEMLGQIRLDTFVLITVPNFPDPAHVRFFKNAAAVKVRYKHLFSDVRIDTFLPDRSGMKYFLMEGTRADVPQQAKSDGSQDLALLLGPDLSTEDDKLSAF